MLTGAEQWQLASKMVFPLLKQEREVVVDLITAILLFTRLPRSIILPQALVDGTIK